MDMFKLRHHCFLMNLKIMKYILSSGYLQDMMHLLILLQGKQHNILIDQQNDIDVKCKHELVFEVKFQNRRYHKYIIYELKLIVCRVDIQLKANFNETKNRSKSEVAEKNEESVLNTMPIRKM